MKTLLLALSAIAMATTAQAQVTKFQGSFAPEANGASGSGTLRLAYDAAGHTLTIDATFAGLSGSTSNAHIHCCTPAPNSGTAVVALAQGGMLPGFPLGVSGATYQRVIDLTQTSQYSAGFVAASNGTAAGAEARLIANLASGNAYFNIHTTPNFGPGEIRAFVTAVPEVQTSALMLLGLGVLGWSARRRLAG